MKRLVAWASSPAALGGRLLAAFAFYAAALDLGWSRGLVGVVGSPAGVVLLVASGLLLVLGAIPAALRTDGPALARAATALLLAGAGVALAALPMMVVGRSTRTIAVGEGQELGGSGDLPVLRFGEVSLAPRGPHVLSKTVDVEASPDGGPPVRIGLFPPTMLGDWRLSVFRFGYAAGVTWVGEGGRPLVGGAFVVVGTLPHTAEESALVTWTPEPNVMMGAGTFPPKLEELVSPAGSDAHLFLRLDEATIAGARRDLRDPDAYRWLVDGRLEQALFHVQVLRGKQTVFEGPLRAGESVEYPGGAVAIAPEVLLWVDLLATRDPWLTWIGVGLGLLAAGGALRFASAAARARRLIRAART